LFGNDVVTPAVVVEVAQSVLQKQKEAALLQKIKVQDSVMLNLDQFLKKSATELQAKIDRVR